jgi:uncharacterized protein (TIGR03545 family)
MKNPNELKKTATSKDPKGIKKLIRLEAVLPVIIVILVFGLYFKFFFDLHVKKGLEWGLTKALGVEVDIQSFETKFTELSLKIQKIEITDSNNPNQNVVQVGQVRFSALWDALLRAKIVVNEAVVEKIEFGVPRGSPGFVAPPDPIEVGPSAADKLKDKSLNVVANKYEDNVLGDAASWLGNTNQDPLEGLKANLESKALIEKFQREISEKQKEWDSRLKSLPKPEEFEALGKRISQVKTSNFKDINELSKSLKELDGIIKEADSKYKTLDSANKDINADIKKIDQELKLIQSQVQTDIKELQNHLKIPKLDSKSIAKSIFASYLAPYEEKFFRYKKLADKYLPPNLMKKGNKNEPDESIQPRPRANGMSYEFGRPRSYPLFWVKRTRISSQAGMSPYAGFIDGEIRNISSNQLLTGEPIVAEIKGDFPAAQLMGLYTKFSFDNRKKESLIVFLFDLNSYPVQTPKELVKSSDISLNLTKANGRLNMSAQLLALKNFDLDFKSTLTNFSFETQAKQKIVKEIFENSLKSLPEISITAEAKGTFPKFPLNIDSNLGRELGKAFEAELRAQVEKAKKELQAKVDAEIGKNKEALEKQIADLKNKVQGQIEKLQNQAENQKKLAENKINVAKKDGENKGKKQIEKEGTKALEKLKKKFKL